MQELFYQNVYYIASIAGFTLVLYLAYKLDRNKSEGLIPRVYKFLNKYISLVSNEVIEFFYYLIGREKNSNATIFDERTFETILKYCIAISTFIAIVTFFGTYTASKNFADLHGLNETSWAIPIAIDLVSVLLAMSIFSYTIAGKPTGKLKLGLLVYSSISIYFNVLHAIENQSVNFSIILLGSIFPISLFVSIETLSLLNSARLSRNYMFQTDQDLSEEIEKKRLELSKLQSKIEKVKSNSNGSTSLEISTRDKVLELNGKDKSVSDIASILNVSQSLVYKYLREK